MRDECQSPVLGQGSYCILVMKTALDSNSQTTARPTNVPRGLHFQHMWTLSCSHSPCCWLHTHLDSITATLAVYKRTPHIHFEVYADFFSSHYQAFCSVILLVFDLVSEFFILSSVTLFAKFAWPLPAPRLWFWFMPLYWLPSLIKPCTPALASEPAYVTILNSSCHVSASVRLHD